MKKKIGLLLTLTLMLIVGMAMTTRACELDDCAKVYAEQCGLDYSCCYQYAKQCDQGHVNWNQIFMDALGLSTLEEFAAHIEKYGPVSLNDIMPIQITPFCTQNHPLIRCCERQNVIAHGNVGPIFLLDGQRVSAWLYTCGNCRTGLGAMAIEVIDWGFTIIVCICPRVDWWRMYNLFWW